MHSIVETHPGATPTARDRLVRYLRARWLGAPLSPAEARDYAEVARTANVRNGKNLLGVLGLLNLLWWATDSWVFARSPQTLHLFSAHRPFFTAEALLGYLVLDWTARRRLLPPELVAAAFAGLIFFEAASLCGNAGGPASPWFSFLYLMMLAPLAISCRFRLRLFLETAAAATLVLGYFQFRISYWNDVFTPAILSVLFFAWLFGIGAGELGERRRQQTFLLRRAVAEKVEELREWNERLESRVEAQTRELRALTAYNDSAREDERARIARELHDELGQELTALRYALNVTEKRYQRESTSIAANLHELNSLLARTAATTRHLVTDLRPRVLDDLGLGAAAEWLVRRTNERTGIDGRLVTIGGDLRVPDGVAIAAFRILQESLTNVARHAQATRVDVALTCRDGSMLLTIADNGVGIASRSSAISGQSGLSEKTGMGLLGMRERARALGGELVISETAPHGTTVCARFPVVTPSEVS